jgi:hypothetical protein
MKGAFIQMENPRKKVIRRDDYLQLTQNESEDYRPCDSCSNYFLVGTGGRHEDYANIHFCSICAENQEAIDDDISNLKLITRGQHTNSDGTGGKQWWVFPKGTSVLKAISFLDQVGICVDGFDTGVSWSPSGRRFANPVSVRPREKTVVAVQSWSLDV